MFGTKLDYDTVDYDKHLALIEGQPGAPFDLIVDGMSGQYAVAGKIIAQSDKYDGMVFTEITDEMLPKDVPALQAEIETAFGAPVDKLRLYLFSHYS